MNPSILYQEHAHVATITLNRPEVHNAFDDVMIHALKDAIDRANANDTIRVIVLNAAGPHFSAGADLQWMQRSSHYSQKENERDALALADLMHALYHSAKPTVALAQGAVFGGGVGLVACCDIVLTTTEAVFCLSEVKLGLIPAVIGPYVAQAIGARAFKRYAITAERIDASQALAMGLVHEIVAPIDLAARTDTLIKLILLNAPHAIRELKQFTHEFSMVSLSPALSQQTATLIARLRASPEGREGIQAFLEKRKPNWSS